MKALILFSLVLALTPLQARDDTARSHQIEWMAQFSAWLQTLVSPAPPPKGDAGDKSDQRRVCSGDCSTYHLK